MTGATLCSGIGAPECAVVSASAIARFWLNVERKNENECWPWRKKIQTRYPKLWNNGKTINVHVLSFRINHGSIPSGCVVMHSCDNTKCANPNHLKLGTQIDNRADCISKKRQAKGSSQGHAVLDESKVLEIKKSLADGIGVCALGRKFGVATCTISDIKHGRSWKHVEVAA